VEDHMAMMNQEQGYIELTSMSHLVEVCRLRVRFASQLSMFTEMLIKARTQEDDWTGVTDAATRRRIQTRLNTRALRKWT
jgi:SPX domain protein involved in polyphosphate accumulation